MTSEPMGAKHVRLTKRGFVVIVAGASCTLFLPLSCGGQADMNSRARPNRIEVTWTERTCAGPYADGPYPVQEVLFGEGRANVPLPPVFAQSADAGAVAEAWARTDLNLNGTPQGKGQRIVACAVAVEQVARVTALAPFTIERDFTWTGTRSEPCNTLPMPPPSGCHVVQQVVYPVDVPRDAGP